MSKPNTTCPSYSPRCDGELRITETLPGGELVSVDTNGEKTYAPWTNKPVAARCCKCGKRWTSEHLETEGINIKDLRMA